MLYDIHKPFPVCKDVLTHFVAYLYKEGLKAGTIKSYLATIRYTHIVLGLGNPHIDSMARLEYMVRGIKRLTNAPTRTRLPITVPLLDQMHRSWSTDRPSRDALMLWAAASMCFFGFLRMGEVIIPSGVAFDPSVHLSVADVSMFSSEPRKLTRQLPSSHPSSNDARRLHQLKGKGTDVIYHVRSRDPLTPRYPAPDRQNNGNTSKGVIIMGV